MKIYVRILLIVSLISALNVFGTSNLTVAQRLEIKSQLLSFAIDQMYDTTYINGYLKNMPLDISEMENVGLNANDFTVYKVNVAPFVDREVADTLDGEIRTPVYFNMIKYTYLFVLDKNNSKLYLINANNYESITNLMFVIKRRGVRTNKVKIHDKSMNWYYRMNKKLYFNRSLMSFYDEVSY